ncbi:MAG: UDP-N-acetylmuramoyl-tripeptide--D-alanyl-D-alanine ligase [Endomicrobiaceae bacterium]|nr:UDP-N-acetylmuramoyl-tripeptide--D-alanyl-D-alanine ligase [Endomicrobiaceae bacterium]MDD3921913.1 UDP-N-acetylmuramoyl-tripeptide--D-alanyl-D-alanine ligase [Endomicrobiaceae bacterium]MDD5101513.1 UDP-N-acetylmuramoyl-tripeptide--D-alanyl-D-alanine ligase [Endomicrobiaceae bacterium]
MENFYLMDLINAVKGSFIIGNPHLQIEDVAIDTRTLKQGSLFFAIQGKNFDGHDFIRSAIEKQVAAIVYSREDINLKYFFPNLPSLVKVKNTSLALEQLAIAYRKRHTALKSIAITGSNGKTTTKEMLSSILKRKYKTLSNKGNYNNRIGVPLTVFDLTSDTRYAVFELGTSEFGEIEALTNIVLPDCGIITNIGSSHLQYFKTPENVLQEKKNLIEGIKKDGFIAINNDNQYLKTYLPQISKKVITFGLYSGADIYAKNIKLWLDKPVFDMYIDGKSETIELPIKGKFNIFNALGAAAVAYGLGFSFSEIKEGLANFTPPNMRMQSYKLSNEAIIINDAYNANPSSMRESISSLSQSYPDKEVILILGDMLELGENAAEYHSEIGKFINTLPYVKMVCLFGDLVGHIKNEIKDKKIKYFMSKRILLEELEKELNANTLVFIKASRGMKLDVIYDEMILRDKIKGK